MDTGLMVCVGADVEYRFVKDGTGRWLQFWYTITPTNPEPIAKQIGTVARAEDELFAAFGLDRDTAAVKRFFSSDLISHHDAIMSYRERYGADFFISVTEQPPASGAKVVLLGMCLSYITAKHREDDYFFLDTAGGVRHIFAEHLVDRTADEHADSENQTRRIFRSLEQRLAEFGTSVEDGVLRTWIYAPHVDADYPGIVRARKEFFDSVDLNETTHYIASTGIQGGTGSRFARVSMDAYAVTGIDKGRVRYVQAPDHLCPTHLYGVTFERATAVALGKTDFLFISGTASIDNTGAIVYPGDVEKQTDRTLENISALLDSSGFARGDLTSLIVYLRDSADYDAVRPLVDIYAPATPVVYVKAPVCRPGWLVEIEATAARALGTARPQLA